MNRRYPGLRGLLIMALLASGAASLLAAPAKPPTPAPPSASASSRNDTIFAEIKLTNEGVNAYDTGGHAWLYNFESNSFIRDLESPDLTTRDREEHSAVEASLGPVKDRCVNQKIVKPWQKTVVVGDDEFVDGDVLALERVIIKGWVKGDVQSVNGRVIVSESGQIDGDVKAPDIMVKKGGKVGGKQIKTSPFEFTEQFSVDGIIVVCGFIGFLLVASFLIVSLFPRQLRNLTVALTEHRAQSIGLGILMIFLLPVIALLIAITIVGIVVLPLLPLLYLVAIAMGVTAFSEQIGRRVFSWLRYKSESALLNASIGVVVFMVPWILVAVLLGSDDSTAQGFGVFVLVMSIIYSLFPICSGVGAGLMTRLGYREYRGRIFRRPNKEADAPAPAPPPIPQVNPIVPPAPISGLSPLTPPMEGQTPRPPLNSNPDIKPPLPSGGA